MKSLAKSLAGAILSNIYFRYLQNYLAYLIGCAIMSRKIFFVCYIIALSKTNPIWPYFLRAS